MRHFLKRFLLLLLGLFLLAQFFRPDRYVPLHEAQADLLEMTQAPPEVAQLVRAACYDCHSYQTKYPWYAAITPVNFFLQDHINHAREHLNFSRWDRAGMNDDAQECGEVIREKEMPFESYLPLHPEADLSDAQREFLATWFDRVTGAKGKGERKRKRKKEGEED